MLKIEKSIELSGRKLTLSTGYLATQADGAVLASYGDTVVLATVVAKPLTVDLGYFPMTVDYQERLYAGGRIKGSRWVKREGRSTDEEILSARLIDRSLRPLFPKTYSKEVQIIITVLSVDLENSPEIVSAIAASAAIAISNISWNGPIGVVKVGYKDNNLIINPKKEELITSDMDLVVSSTKDSIVMVEAGTNQVTEERILEGIKSAQKEISKIIDLINELTKEVKPIKEKTKEVKLSQETQKKIKELSIKKLKEIIPRIAAKENSYSEYDELKTSILELFEDEEEKLVIAYLDNLLKEQVRSMILSSKRPDGRKLDEIRKISCEVGVLPRTHGSAIFQRGQTQALSIATLGAPSQEQLIETASGEETKRYIHHYSMPPYSTGEVGKIGFPSRREIGHGALAERALLPVIPSEDEFPYTIRVVTEVLSSNGSTSMASTCGSTLSLLDAGVPIKSSVGGIAMGLVIEDHEKYKILTDIVGLEDFYGDMDFKVTGTKDGITALQLDVKTLSLTATILKEALSQAKNARLKILEVMNDLIASPRKAVSKYAPKIKILRIDQDKIGELIGPGGKTIRKIILETGAQIEVDDSGRVFVSGNTEEELLSGVSRIEAIVKEPQAGEIYEGTVKRIQPFGAFVEILPGKEGLVHVSDISQEYVKDPSDVLKIGDKVEIRVKGIDDLGRLNLSMVLDPAYDLQKEERRKEKHFNNRSFNKSERKNRRGMGGPHFPRSRFLSEKKKFS